MSELKGSSSHSSGHSLLADTWHFVCFVLLCFALKSKSRPVDHKASKNVRFFVCFFFFCFCFFFSSVFFGGGHCVNVAGLCWARMERQVRQEAFRCTSRNTHTTHTHWERACYLPCSSGNSPTSSDNLDQSVGSMNPHLPGAQDKISRPSQVVRDWRHEITFGVFLTHYCLSKHNAGAGEHTRTRAHESTHAHGAEESGGVCVWERVCVCARYSSLTSVRGRTSAPTLVMMRSQSSSRMRKKSARSLAQRTQFREDSHTRVGKNYPVEQIKAKNKKQPSNLDPLSFVSVFLSVLKPVLSQQLVSAQPLVSPLSLLSGLHTGFVMEVHILALVPVQKWLDFPLPCDLCR